jgi:multiple sugar transport system substrate-binding protein
MKRKKIIAILLGAAILISMSACSVKDSGTGTATASNAPVETPKKDADPVEIKLWTRSSGPDAGYVAIIDKFNSEHPDIKVTYEYFGENYASVVQMAVAAGNPPELLEASTGVTVQSLVRQNILEPVDDLITDDLKARLHPDTLKPKEFYYEGKLYSVPVRLSAYRLLYNRDLFISSGLDPEKPPTTMEEMREVAKTITAAGAGDSYGFGLPLGVGQIWERVIDPIVIAMNVGGRYGYNEQTGKYDFSTNVAPYDVYLGLLHDGSLFPGYLTLGIDALRANFAQGKVGMYIDGNWMVGNYATQIEVKCDWDSAPLPVLAGSTAGKYWAEGGVNWVITKGPHSDAAKEFYKVWLTSQSLANQALPAPRTDLEANKLENLPVEELKLKGLKYSFETEDLMIPEFEPHKFISLEGDDRNKVFTNIFADASEGKDVTAAVQAAVEDLNTRYTAALDKAITDGTISASDVPGR